MKKQPLPKDLPRIISAEHVEGYVVRIKLSNGEEVLRDFDRVVGDGFRPPRDLQKFKKVLVERGHVAWKVGRKKDDVVDFDVFNTIWGHYPQRADEKPCRFASVGDHLACKGNKSVLGEPVPSEPKKRR